MNKQGKIAIIAALFLVAVLAVSFVFAAPRAPKPECNDRIDNDGDGYIDLADAGCSSRQDNDESNCGDGICEGGETYESCPADCPIPDSCSDSDGGWNILVQGTASGYLEGNPYSDTDYCVDISTLKEYYCAGSHVYNINFGCANETSSCVNGACI